MYGIFTYMYQKKINQTIHVGKYTMTMDGLGIQTKQKILKKQQTLDLFIHRSGSSRNHQKITRAPPIQFLQLRFL